MSAFIRIRARKFVQPIQIQVDLVVLLRRQKHTQKKFCATMQGNFDKDVQEGVVLSVSGPVVTAEKMEGSAMYELVRKKKLIFHDSRIFTNRNFWF